MVIATMADSEREELEKLIEDWNASRLDMFTLSKPDANLAFSGNMRFYFQESGAKDRKVSTKVLRVSSSDTTDDVMKVLVSKFHPDMKMLTMPNYSLYEVHETGSEAHKLEMDQRPLFVQLYWQQYDRDGRFLLKSEEDQMSQKLFEDEESSRNPDKRNLKQRQSKRGGKNKKKNAQKEAEESPKSLATALFEDKPESSFTRSKSNPEAVMKRQRKKKLEDRLKKLQDPETSGGGGGPLRIFAENLQPENPYKTILCASNDTTETVLKDALEKYEVPAAEMDQYCLTMVTIAPGNHSDPESSSGVKERVVPDRDCPAAIAASWPESSGELRFYLKKKENMPKRKQQPRKRSDDTHGRVGVRPGPTMAEHSPPPTKETTFDVTVLSTPTDKEPGSPAVHIVDAVRDLPATLEFRESGEDAFFAVVVSEVNGSAVNFKLAPTFTLYMCCRYRLSPKFRPDFPPNKRREKVAMTAKKVANMMWQTVKENHAMAGHLAFWMANSSEFLHFLKQDVELSSMTEESQKILAHTTQQAFRSLVHCIKEELQSCLPAFLDPSEESELDENGGNIDDSFDPMQGYQSTERSFKVKHYGPHGQPLGGDQWLGKRKKTSRPILSDILYTLKAAMSLLRRCRVNPALTIQLFSQVFHFINMWLFNRIVLEPQLRLCSRSWGVRLRERLERLQSWAESQGLELAAECHLARISQAALLLQIPKQDSTAIASHCYKLNSVQLRQLLELYQPERDEPSISLELIEKAVSTAESTADEIARSEGQEVRLEEELDLHLPFLLPDDGYSSEKIRGVPPGLKEFLDPLITPGLCRLTIQPKASGLWTVHFKIPVGLEIPSPEVVKISMNKGNKGMGVSIVAAKGAGQEHYGIYVQEVIDGGTAAQDGRLQAGDQIIDVNGESLVGVQQEEAVKILKNTGSAVHMTVAKKAVYLNGLVELLTKTVQPNNNVKVEASSRGPENRNLSPLAQKKEIPRAPPRYRPPQDSPHNVSVQSESEQKQMKPEPSKRRNPYDGQYNDWKSRQDGPPVQPPVQAKTVVEYQLDEPPSGPVRKPVKAGVPLPYANPLEIQRRQREMQQRKVEDERREQEKENFERDRIASEQERVKRVQEEREEAERLERERIKREEQARREQERLKSERLEKEQQERQRIEKEERQRIEREQQERQRMEREQQERQRIEREQQDRQRIEREQHERQRREREDIERKRKEEWEKKEREREEFERGRQEEWKKQEQERIDRQQREKEEHEKRLQQENAGLDEMTRRERELEMMLEQKRRDKEKRLKELQRLIQEQEEEGEREVQEIMDRLKREREERERKEPQRITRPTGGSTQVHYVNDQGKGHEKEEPQREVNRIEAMRSNRPADYGKRGPAPTDESRNNHPVDYARRPPLPNEDNRVNYGPGKRPSLQDTKDESFEMDPAEVERQFQQRLAQEAAGKSEVDGPIVKVIRVPVQQDNWEPRGNARDMEERPRVRVDYQREEEQRNRKEQQWRRDQDEQLVRDFQQNESLRPQPAPAVAEPVHQHQGDWEKDEELRRQREEDDRLREARANQLRNRIIERPEDDADVRSGGRTRRVQFASVRTEIIQPSPDAEVAKHDVKFVHDSKVMDSDDEDFPRPPPPVDEDDAPPPPQDQIDYFQRPPPPPKPQNLISNGGSHPPEYHGGYRDNDHIARARVRVSDDGYATHPGRQQHVNNNHPTPKPRALSREAEQFGKSPSPDQAKLPFKDKMKVFNDNTPPKRQTASKWEQKWVNGDSL